MNAIAGRIASDATYQAIQEVKREEKTCKKCGESKILRDFPISGYQNGKRQYRSRCRECFNADFRADVELGKRGRVCDTCKETRYPGAYVKGSPTCQRCVKANINTMPSCHPMLLRRW